MYSVAEHAADEIEYAQHVFGLEADRLGIVMGIQYDENSFSPVISYNVRVVEGPREDYRIDLDYTFENATVDAVLSDIYPECVRTMKARFPEAQLQYQRSPYWE